MRLLKPTYQVNSHGENKTGELIIENGKFRNTQLGEVLKEDFNTYNVWSPVAKDLIKETKATHPDKFVPILYTRRWLYLAIAIIINISDGALWICYASVTNTAAKYYNVSVASINWLSMVFFIVYLPVIFYSMWVYDKSGFKHGIWWACGTNLAGSVVRLFGTFDFVPPSYRFPITLAGQSIAALTQPFCMCMPTKISQDWFPENERNISTTLVSLSNLAGSMAAALASPAIAITPNDIPLMNIIMCGFGIFAGALGVFVRDSRPLTPPSISAAEELENKVDTTVKSYLTQIKDLLLNWQFLLLMFTAAATVVGIVYTLLTVLQQMLCSFNYSNQFSGVCTAVMIAGGIVGSIGFSALASKTKKLEEIVVIGFSISVLVDIILILLCNHRGLNSALIIVSLILGIINLGIYPVCLEVSVEITYPIEQSISAGLIAFWQQIQGAAFVPLITNLGNPLNTYEMRFQTCTDDSTTTVFDMTNGGLCLVGLITLFDILLLVFFNPTFKRSELERLKMLQSLQLVNNAQYNVRNTNDLKPEEIVAKSQSLDLSKYEFIERF